MIIEVKERYKVIRPEEGYVLTNYKEGDDIKQYAAFSECICPLSCSTDHLREITKEESKEYIELAKASK